jgi:tetratricopeptide (TPR) repeat protein
MLLRKPIGILFLFFFCLCLNGQNAKLHIKAGEQFFTNGMYDAALDEFNKAVTLDPNDGKTYFDIASVMLYKTDSVAAAQNFQKAAVMGYNPGENFFNAANLFYLVHQNNIALDNIESGLAIKSKNFDLWLLKTKILFETGRYDEAGIAANEAIKANDMAIAYYYKGVIAYKLGKLEEAEKALEMTISRDNNFADAFIELAKVQIKLQKYDYAVDNCSNVLLLIDPENIDALQTRSLAFNFMHEPQQAIDDITKAISFAKNNWILYMLRAKYNLDFALYSTAADDYTIALSINDTLTEAYRNRAAAYEQLGRKIDARNDYVKLKSIYENLNPGIPVMALVDAKIFELGREISKPVITFSQPGISEKSEFKISQNDSLVLVKGIITDESGLKEAKLNNSELELSKNTDGTYTFEKKIKSSDIDFISLSALDIYDNLATVSYPIIYVENDAPVIKLLSPAPEGTNIIHLESGDNTLYIEGKVEDASNISAIKIDEFNASFAPGDLNPRFTSTIDIKNRKNITLTATDKFGNITEQTYEFARDGYLLSGSNPMGKTWAVIIENSDYKEFSLLPNTEKDIAGLKEALSRYKISKVMHMKNMSKREMERFFAIDLRDLITTNNVNSIMVWYAGHGKFINNSGYWIPVDAKYNDEYSYYNINALKASLYSYVSLTHILLISDACAAGESFSLAMRGDNSLANCDNEQLVTQKSALVLTSTDSEPAMDNSLFAQTFINALNNNPADCIPIDAIAERVSLVMQKQTAQKPVFGRISGLENNNGTFFFVAR